MKIERPLVTYQHEHRNISHHILTLHTSCSIILMSAVNLFLKERAYKSIKTSERYSSAIKRFFEFIIQNNEHVTPNFWREVKDSDLREWQGYIVQNRDRKRKQKPSDDTVFKEACIVFDFYSWARENKFPTLINTRSIDWKYSYRDESRLLSSKSILSGSNPDYSNIDTGNKRSQHSKSSKSKQVTIMNLEDIKALVCSYNDAVYPAIFLLALATGMREQGVCSVPYIGLGRNDHIRPYPDIQNTIPKDSEGNTPKTFDFTIVEKGKKMRTLKVNMAAWKVICKIYLPLYYQRRKLFEIKHPDKDANAFFFLNKSGHPVTPKMIADRTYIAKMKLRNFRWSFHNTRDWYATMFIIKHLSRDKINASHYDAAIEDSLRRQLGHSDIRTTYMHYVRVASILLATQNGELDFSLGKDDYFWGDIIEGKNK
ncbi:Tyr recombinase domain-containing protein [Vibrio crassostreae]|uniref:site-specific integrase n=1 Tax=Vibrio crassostreae TaxID=246167 RepID=UPI001BD1BFC7|nr:site-specific integrase [Vibrio crassostreae]CAK1757328.1 Tyr recombinase domain-containing protein [Vibrio crassostreae]CAK1757981.1 Tyr recombinase domain-containing protein [Vibrio crassostreae]CAK2376045.1 Tyr recombinase domain-containing protein [Vibrio crassostreae]CAK2386606.1 Tyr recombinase domain-containing protein [Vibrio crassostreae]CAK2386625.1 Tyr recombinase domain-containing protein [Vibrio crassostreae]